jgi:hypothetical protein
MITYWQYTSGLTSTSTLIPRKFREVYTVRILDFGQLEISRRNVDHMYIASRVSWDTFLRLAHISRTDHIVTCDDEPFIQKWDIQFPRGWAVRPSVAAGDFIS